MTAVYGARQNLRREPIHGRGAEEMPPDSLADVERRLHEVYSMLDALSGRWDDISLKGQVMIAGEHVRIALDALRQVEECSASGNMRAE